MRMKNRISAMLLAVVFAASICLPSLMAFADDSVITIESGEQLAAFAKKCKSDSWSRGKTVRLEADIDISDTDFSCIPTFGGTFLGNGHTISGLNIKSKGSNLGLFRYIQNGAVVDGLHVKGNAAPEGSRKNIGGIVGENSGTVVNCSFSGNVSGDANIGGICGYITESGKVSGCEFDGILAGKSYSGGIAGQNFGLIENCSNSGSINTRDSEEKKTIQDIDLDVSNIRTTENIDAATDTGGICGYSKGRIIGCENRGDVGYRSVGYNTGGICGRQAGFISNCTNRGTVNGRKDVGGIVGQAEPYILLEYTEDALQQINDVFARIRDIMKNNVLVSDDDLWDSLDRLDTGTNGVTDTTQGISDNAEKYADSLADSVNDASERLHKALDDSTEALDSMASGADKISEGTEALRESCDYLKHAIDVIENAGDNLDSALSMLQKSTRRLSQAFDELEDCAASLEDGTEKLIAALKELSKAIDDKNNITGKSKDVWNSLIVVQEALYGIGGAADDIADAADSLVKGGYADPADISGTIDSLRELAAAYRAIAKALSAVGDACLTIAESFDIYSLKSAMSMFGKGMDYLSKAIGSMRWTIDDLREPSDGSDGLADSIRKATEKMQDGLKSFEGGMDDISLAVRRFSDIAEEMNAGGVIKIPVASEVFGSSFDDFFDAVRGVQDELSELKSILRKKKNKLSDDIDDLSDELSRASDIMSDAYDDHIKADDDGFVEDISDTAYSGDVRGRIEESQNLGTVDGDINVGGVVGSMAVEYDFDPEDDVKNSGEKSLKFTYKTKCVVRRCRNDSPITSKKDYCGGVVGRMDLGSVLSCENYGDIKSDDGNYIGGIAGMSDTVIRNSASKCGLSGVDYVGGIVGQGSTVSNCYALVSVFDFGECAGSVAGSLDKEESLKNFFVSDTLGGVDDVSYDGIAAETDVDSFVGFVKSGFDTDVTFTLTFVCDDKEIARVPFTYRESIPDGRIPKVPNKKGYYGKWSQYDFSDARYDATITAEYFRSVELLESSVKRENGKAVVLVCGAFSDEAAVTAVPNKTYPAALNGKKVYDSYAVEISSAYNEKYKIRYLPMEKKKSSIYVKCGDKVQKVNVKSFGSYFEFETGDSSFTIYEVKKSNAPIVILCFVGAACVLIVVRRIIRKKKAKRLAEKEE